MSWVTYISLCVSLQALKVKLYTNFGTRDVRALIDTELQSSNILKSTALELECHPKGNMFSNTVCSKCQYSDTKLLEADVAGTLYTGRQYILSCGLVAIDTLLGWAIMGRLLHNHRNNTVLTVISLLSKDILSSKNPSKRKSKKK